MSIREFLFAVASFLAAAAITYGVDLIYRPAGWIVAGILLLAWAWMLLAEGDT